MIRCLKCHEVLVLNNKSYQCKNKHNYDCAKSGYVNLLQSQKSNTKQHGDDKAMLLSRKHFLDKGYYQLLANKLRKIINPTSKDTILDAGCGEGWYCEQIGGNTIGVDISRNGCDLAAKRNKDMTFIVASTFDLPITDGSIDCVYSVFAPFDVDEMNRILSANGRFIHVFPLEKHLWELKEAIYFVPYENEQEEKQFTGFELESKHEVKDMIHLPSVEDIKNLFSMTPYVHRTSIEEMKRLNALTEISSQIQFGINVYRKQ